MICVDLLLVCFDLLSGFELPIQYLPYPKVTNTCSQYNVLFCRREADFLHELGREQSSSFYLTVYPIKKDHSTVCCSFLY